MSETKAGAKILVVDDEPNNLEVLGRLLSNDYQVLVATDGETGLALAVSQQPDLILLDVMMPELGGYAVCTRLKAEEATRDIPVIFVTAMSDTEHESEGFHAGGVDYVIKPVNPVTLRARVKTHLDLKHKNDLLRSLATLDALTGIANRRRLDEFLEKEWRRCVRAGTTPLSLILLDIDYFKDYNDYYGHQEGDRCLRRVAGLLQGTLERSTDLVARYGGEEFCCIMPETHLIGAIHLAEKIQRGILGLSILHKKSKVSPFLTVSMGVAVSVPEMTNTPAQLLEETDRRLYLAKQMGRNQFYYQDYDLPREAT
ncbi:two-component system, chemotaxis family, response regulator WspR [Gammaproteobacteria bacterium]